MAPWHRAIRGCRAGEKERGQRYARGIGKDIDGRSAIARAARVIRQQADLHAFQRGEPGGAKHVDTGLHRRVDRRRYSWCLRIKHAARAWQAR